MSNILVLGCGTQGFAMARDFKGTSYAVFFIQMTDIIEDWRNAGKGEIPFCASPRERRAEA